MVFYLGNENLAEGPRLLEEGKRGEKSLLFNQWPKDCYHYDFCEKKG